MVLPARSTLLHLGGDLIPVLVHHCFCRAPNTKHNVVVILAEQPFYTSGDHIELHQVEFPKYSCDCMQFTLKDPVVGRLILPPKILKKQPDFSFWVTNRG